MKYYNNILGTGNRVAHIDRSIDPSCTFCRKSGNLPPPLESFSHIFYDCPTVEKIFNVFKGKFIQPDINREQFFVGYISENYKDNFPLIMVLNCFRFCIWEQKLRGVNPSYYTVENETINLLEIIAGANRKINISITNSSLLYIEGDGAQRRGQAAVSP